MQSRETHLSPYSLVLFSLVVLQTAVVASAHRPALTRPSCSPDFGSSRAALDIDGVTVSWSFKHYLDCSSRAVWMKFRNPSPDFLFYVGVGIPPVPRFADLRADVLVVGPGLMEYDEPELRSLGVPAEVLREAFFVVQKSVRRDLLHSPDVISATNAIPGGASSKSVNDSARSSSTTKAPAATSASGTSFSPQKIPALVRRAPLDQSSCGHLGPTMTDASRVRNGRCDFYEPYGQTHSWRVLDADLLRIPIASEEYFVAVYFQEDVSGKLGIAYGTWQEDFATNFRVTAPSCHRAMDDFSEKGGEQTDRFPSEACPGGAVGGGGGGGPRSSSTITGSFKHSGTTDAAVDGDKESARVEVVDVSGSSPAVGHGGGLWLWYSVGIAAFFLFSM